MNKEKYELWDEFLKRWPYEKLKDMTLEEYTNLNKDYFCYWLESKTDKLGSVWGGSAFKFGVFRRKNDEERENANGYIYSDRYAWLQKYGENEQEAFQKIKETVLKIVEYSQKGEFEKIDDIDMGDVIKWKIAFLYQDRNNPKVIPIFKREILKYLCGVSKNSKITMSKMYAKLMGEKPDDEDIFEYVERLMGDENGNGGTIPKELKEKIDKILENKRQIILYGVPGTGKTWLANNYVKKETDDNKNKHEFTTFHQSYSYEDFIEGFRPKNDENGNIIYEVEDGIFKRMCILAIWSADINNVNFYKVSLGEKDKEEDKRIFEYCIKNNVICVGFKNDTDYTKYSLNADKIDEKEMKRRIDEVYDSIDKKGVYVNPPHKSSIKYIVLEMKKGDIVLVSDGTTKIKAIGEITGDYEYKKDSPLKDFNMYQFRKVKWLWIGNDENKYIDINKILNEKESFGRSTIHKLDKNNLDIEFLKELIINNLPYKHIKKEVIKKLSEHKNSKNIFKKEDFKNAPKYYLIIDEINRGNISNILGELITLLEKDKRLGEDNEIITTLPYSKEPFAVPPNLYIIGTMNTADKSIALLDIALRRRFGFMEIEPNYELLKDKNIEGINLAELLKVLNEEIVKSIDRDHRIGHSYFLKVKNIEDLKFVWYYEIIPLLEEYFYSDIEGLKKVLGGFIKNDEINKELDDEGFIEALNKIIGNN